MRMRRGICNKVNKASYMLTYAQSAIPSIQANRRWSMLREGFRSSREKYAKKQPDKRCKGRSWDLYD